jgi:pyrimidine operon attenuation protein/uracil phosphoribosyltransferase
VAADFVADAVTLQPGQSLQLQRADDGSFSLMVHSNA